MRASSAVAALDIRGRDHAVPELDAFVTASADHKWMHST